MQCTSDKVSPHLAIRPSTVRCVSHRIQIQLFCNFDWLTLRYCRNDTSTCIISDWNTQYSLVMCTHQ